uniref:Uncharacterized protein n=1 Tax=Brassica campestris TaxID=3711 RepID=A0A3P6BB66_BRACM|nr:unnamed protein product [Brassica rapa]
MSSGPGNFCLVHVSLVPVLNVVGEQCLLKPHFALLLSFRKLKPAQHSVRGLGLTPDILACRSTKVCLSSRNFEYLVCCLSSISDTKFSNPFLH